MKVRVTIAAIVGIALLLSLGAWVTDASADSIMFPWIVRSADVTTVISVVNTAETDAEALGLPFHNNRIHIEYWHKLTTDNDQEEKCRELSLSYRFFIKVFREFILKSIFLNFSRWYIL